MYAIARSGDQGPNIMSTKAHEHHAMGSLGSDFISYIALASKQLVGKINLKTSLQEYFCQHVKYNLSINIIVLPIAAGSNQSINQ